MPDEIRFAAYPSAKVLDADGHQVKHLLWGDWVKVTGPEVGGKVPVHVRNKDGFMAVGDLQTEALLEIVFVDVGQGDGCLVITPDDRKVVIDAGISDNMARFLRWRFNFRGGARTLDAAIITHPDADHYKGFTPLFEDPNLAFRRVFHNGIMEQHGDPFGPEVTEGGVKYITELMAGRPELEAFLADPARYTTKLYANLLKKAVACLTPDGDIRMVAASGDPAHPAYLEGFEPPGEVRLRLLGPVPEPDVDGKPRLRWFRDLPTGGSYSTSKTKNGQSVILMLEYRDLKIFLGGDLNASSETFLLRLYTGLPWPPADSNAEQILIEAARPHLGADIVKCCHHGAADFTDAFMAANGAAATVVSSGDEESHAHPRSDTLGAIGRHGRGWRPLILSTELARSTREDEGTKGVELGRLFQKIESEADPATKAELIKERDRLVDELGERNVTSYGAINLRTDGRRAVLAYMLERERAGNQGGKKTLTKWDIYQLEKVGAGPLVYVPRSSH